MILWSLLLLLIQPIVNFPLNDDWSYAFAVQSWVEDGNLEYRGWMSMTLFAQVVWGSLFAKVFGFSFTILHLSTLVLAFWGSFFTYLLAKSFRINHYIALFIALIITLNPIYLNLSFTFMTDVPFYTFSVISIYFFVQHLTFKKQKYFLLGTLFCIIALLTRQLGLVIPLGLAFIGLLKKEWKLAIPFAIAIIVFLIYQWSVPVFISDIGRSNEHNLLLINKITHHPFTLSLEIIKRTFIFLVYFGLFFAPILVFLRLPKGKKTDWILFVLSLISLFILYYHDFLMPLNKNIIVDFGVGPRTLYDCFVAKSTNMKSLYLFSKLQLTFIGVMYGFKVLEALLLKIRKFSLFTINLYYQKLLLFVIAIFYLFPITAVDNFDRYYLLLFPLIIISIANFFVIKRTFFERFQWVSMFVILFLFTTLANRDYFEWQKARWEGITFLQNELKIGNEKIDGGFEFNGWYNYNSTDFGNNVENIWVKDDEFKICFEPIENYTVIKKIEYREWLKLGRIKTIKVLKRNE